MFTNRMGRALILVFLVCGFGVAANQAEYYSQTKKTQFPIKKNDQEWVLIEDASSDNIIHFFSMKEVKSTDDIIPVWIRSYDTTRRRLSVSRVLIDRWGKLFSSTKFMVYDLDNGTILNDFDSENGKWKIIGPGSLYEKIISCLSKNTNKK